MLRLTIPASESWNEMTEEFSYTKETTLDLEHSLVSLSKWESKWKKAYLGKQAKTDEEVLDYVRCMTITQNVNPDVYLALTPENIKLISDYIHDPMTATTFNKDNGPPNRETVTSELVYYWMVALTIPFECQKWHLNRLMTLIQVANIKNKPPKKMNRRAIQRRNANLNAQRRAAMNSSG